MTEKEWRRMEELELMIATYQQQLQPRQVAPRA
jgi:hypothetical protein